MAKRGSFCLFSYFSHPHDGTGHGSWRTAEFGIASFPRFRVNYGIPPPRNYRLLAQDAQGRAAHTPEASSPHPVRANKKWALFELARVTYSGSVRCRAMSEPRTAFTRLSHHAEDPRCVEDDAEHVAGRTGVISGDGGPGRIIDTVGVHPLGAIGYLLAEPAFVSRANLYPQLLQQRSLLRIESLHGKHRDVPVFGEYPAQGRHGWKRDQACDQHALRPLAAIFKDINVSPCCRRGVSGAASAG